MTENNSKKEVKQTTQKVLNNHNKTYTTDPG